MNILFFARRFYPDIGGVEKHLLEISKRLASRGYTITIVTQSQNYNKKEVSFENINIIRIPKIKNRNDKFFIWKWLWQHKKLIKDADIIHCHDVFYWYLPFRFLYPQKKVFTTFHGYESYPVKKKAILVRKLSEVLSFGNICIGDFIKKWYHTKPTVVSYGAVDSSKFKVQSSKNNSAVFFGRLDEQTGILTYVKTCEILKRKITDFKLLVIGDGKYKKNIDKKVKVIGFQNNIEKYLQQYRFAFVSRYLSILEAFAAKRLVVAVYDNPVKEDYLRMTPFAKFMIIESSAEKLAERLEYILKNPSVEKKLVEGAYHWVKEQSWEKMVDCYQKLWQRKSVQNQSQKKKFYAKFAVIFFSTFLFLAALLYGINFPYVGPNATTANGFSLIAHNFNHYGYIQTKLAPVISIAQYLPKEPVYYFHHPLLLSFTESLFFRVFGEGFWVGRLSVVLLTFGSFILIYFIGKEIGNKTFAIISFLIASLIPGFTIFGKLIDHEPLVLFYCLLSLYSLLKYFHTEKKTFLLLTFAATALGILSDWPAIYFLPSFIPLFIKYKKFNLFSSLLVFSLFVIAMIIGSIYAIKPSELQGLGAGVHNSTINNLLLIPQWPVRFASTMLSRFVVYFNPLLFLFAGLTAGMLIKNVYKNKLTDGNLVIGGLGVFGFFHILLYSYASFTHPYLIYYLVPFVIFGSAVFIDKFFNKKKYIFLGVLFIFCFLYLLTVQLYKNKQILTDQWRYQLVFSANKYLTPYEEVSVNGLSALDSDIFWRFSIIVKSDDNVYALDTQKLKHYIHSCPQTCKADDVQLHYLKQKYQYKHFVSSGGEAYVFFLQQQNIALHSSFNTTEYIGNTNVKENEFSIKVRNIYRHVRDLLHVPQL